MLANIRDPTARQPPGPQKRLALALCSASLAFVFTGCSGRSRLVLHDLRLGLVPRLLRQAEVSVRAFLDRLHTAWAGYGCAGMTESHMSKANSQSSKIAKIVGCVSTVEGRPTSGRCQWERHGPEREGPTRLYALFKSRPTRRRSPSHRRRASELKAGWSW